MNFRRLGFRSAVLGALALIVATAPSAHAEMRNATIQEDTQVLREPQKESEPLGRFRAGTTVRVFVPARNGWYATYFKSPVKGTNYGWMPESVVTLSEGQTAAASPPPATGIMPTPRRTKNASAAPDRGTTFGLFSGIGMINDGVGIKPTFGANLDFPLSEKLILGGSVSWIKINSATDPINANSFLSTAEGFYYFDRAGSGTYVGLKAGVAITLVSGITEIAGIEYETSGSEMTALFAPTLGYDFGGQSVRWYSEGSTSLFGSASILSATIGAKFRL